VLINCASSEFIKILARSILLISVSSFMCMNYCGSETAVVELQRTAQGHCAPSLYTLHVPLIVMSSAEFVIRRLAFAPAIKSEFVRYEVQGLSCYQYFLLNYTIA
jgi:hypothetical protein